VTIRCVLAWAFVALGCAESMPPTAACAAPASLDVELASGPLLNPDESGAPLPTEIRVHQIRDASGFANAPFEDAFALEGTLEDSVVSSRTATLYPGETTTLALTPSPEATAIVGMAVVRRPAGRTWRVIVPIGALPCGEHAALSLRVDEYRIERAEEVR
jgi:type VI secretion system VasD/TssJ family lipoprotein